MVPAMVGRKLRREVHQGWWANGQSGQGYFGRRRSIALIVEWYWGIYAAPACSSKRTLRNPVPVSVWKQ